MNNISQLVQAAHQNAVNKGWWEEPRTYGELIALVHSEVSEALEDYRNGAAPHATWYEKKSGTEIKLAAEQVNDTWKPCGIPSELADICIRIFDIAGHYGFRQELQQACESKGPNWQVVETFPFADNLAVIHLNLSESFTATETMVRSLADALLNTESLAKFYGIDLDRAIQEKMAYNATRPRRHGGKVL